MDLVYLTNPKTGSIAEQGEIPTEVAPLNVDSYQAGCGARRRNF
jgi:hypothetical protein